ncbi:MAG: DUF4126 domain-containing protein [Limnospira sp.]
MNHWLGILCAIGLSAACGFRVFVPPLILSTAAIYGEFELPPDLAILGTEMGLAVAAGALVIEAFLYFIPGLDNGLDVLETPVAIATASLMVAAFLPPMDPQWMWAISIILGGVTAGIIEILTGITRVASTMATGGIANPLLSTMELLAAVILSVLAISLPILGGIVAAIVLVLALQKIISRRWKDS